MKKLISKLLLLIMVLAMVLSLAACGIRKRDSSTESASGNITDESSRSEEREQSASDDNQSTPDSQSENNDQSATDGQTASNGQSYQGSAGKKKNALFGSVADYVNSDAMQAALDSMRNQYSGMGISIDMIAEEENKLVYIFAYESIAHTEGDGMTEALEAAMGTQDAVFQQTANAIKPFVSNDEVIVEIRYVDMNGVIIYSKTYVSE